LRCHLPCPCPVPCRSSDCPRAAPPSRRGYMALRHWLYANGGRRMMSQHDPANAPNSEQEPSATSPASRAQRPGEMRSAVPALCLFGVNLLLVALLVSSSLWPSLFHLSQPHRVVPDAAPIVTATDAVGPQPTDAPPALPTAQATPQATTAPAHASASATTPAQQPSPTMAPATPTTAPPTPTPTWPSTGG
jgi:hypothetical protein